MILCQGGRFGGWSLYLKGGKPAYTYNFLGLRAHHGPAHAGAAARKATVRFEFAYDGGGPRQGRRGDPVRGREEGRRGKDRAHATACLLPRRRGGRRRGRGHAGGRGLQAAAANRFTGNIRKVKVDVKEMTAGEKADSRKAAAEGARKVAEAEYDGSAAGRKGFVPRVSSCHGPRSMGLDTMAW